MKKCMVILAVLIVSLWGASLLANPVLLYEVNVSPAQVVNIEAGSPANYTGGALAGVYNLMIDFDPDDGVDNFQAFSGYCVDPAFAETSATLYDIISIPSDPIYQQVAWIFFTYGTPSDPFLAASVQSAIWIAVDGISLLEPNGRDLMIYLEAAEAVNINGWTAPDWLSLAVSPASIVGSQLPDYQDFIIRTPEPASLLLLGLGLFGAGLVRKKSW